MIVCLHVWNWMSKPGISRRRSIFVCTNSRILVWEIEWMFGYWYIFYKWASFLECFSAAAKHENVEADYFILFLWNIWTFVYFDVWGNICKTILCRNIDRNNMESQRERLVEDLWRPRLKCWQINTVPREGYQLK